MEFTGKKIKHDGKEYEELEFYAGAMLDKCIDRIKSFWDFDKRLVCASFNDHMMYSDTITVDGVYLDVCGMTKQEHDKKREDELKEYERKKNEHEEKIPELTKVWVEKGKEVLDEEYLDMWNDCVPIRLRDLYRGMELECCLDIVKMLNNDSSFEDCEAILDSQGHSGVSYSLVLGMIFHFSKRGKEFNQYIKDKRDNRFGLSK